LSVFAIPLAVAAVMVIVKGGLGPSTFVRYVGQERHVVHWEYHTYGPERPAECASFAVRVHMPNLEPGFAAAEGGTEHVSFRPAREECSGPLGGADEDLERWRGYLGPVQVSAAYDLTLIRSGDPTKGTRDLAYRALLYEKDSQTGRVVRFINCSSPEPEQASSCRHLAIVDGVAYQFDYPGEYITRWHDLEDRIVDLRQSFVSE
jgi:hypothetical protein